MPLKICQTSKLVYKYKTRSVSTYFTHNIFKRSDFDAYTNIQRTISDQDFLEAKSSWVHIDCNVKCSDTKT